MMMMVGIFPARVDRNPLAAERRGTACDATRDVVLRSDRGRAAPSCVGQRRLAGVRSLREKRISFLSAFPLHGCLSVLWLSTTLCLSLSPFVYGVEGEKRLRWWIVLRRYTCEETGRRLRRETLTMPQWAGSCWYYLRFADPRNGERLIGQEEEKCGDHTTARTHTRSYTRPIYDHGRDRYTYACKTLRTDSSRCNLPPLACRPVHTWSHTPSLFCFTHA
eukprot:COSAG06_NODE_7923_length_2333_cov_1.253805_1_plen_220_part_00